MGGFTPGGVREPETSKLYERTQNLSLNSEAETLNPEPPKVPKDEGLKSRRKTGVFQVEVVAHLPDGRNFRIRGNMPGLLKPMLQDPLDQRALRPLMKEWTFNQIRVHGIM